MQRLKLRISQAALITLLSFLALIIAITTVRAAVTLVSFTAAIDGTQAKIEWETASELDLAGFYVLRSLFSDTGYSRISGFIHGTGNSIVGVNYDFIDTGIILGVNYYYKLEDIDINNHSDFHGPVVIGPNTPTPSPTNTPTASETPTATETPPPSNTPTKTARPTKTPTFNPSASPSFTPTPTITFTPSITPTHTKTPTPTPPEADISLPGQIIFPSPTPSPSSTPTPTSPSTGDSFSLTRLLLRAGIISGIILFWVILGIIYFKYISPKNKL